MILVVSYPGEEHTDEVVRLLEAMGREVATIDLGDFPARARIEAEWRPGRPPSYRVEGPSGPIDLGRAGAAWWRRVRPYTVDDAIVDPALRAFVLSETAQALGGVLDALPCAWVNPRLADEAAHHKPLQWTVAEGVGLKVPRTLVTTRPEAARAFVEGIGVGRVVFKAFLAMADAWRETRVVTREDLGRLDLVRYAPVIFQEYVEGVDLRITIVGDRVFAAEIDARGTAYPFDMRVVLGESKVRPVDLPPDVQAGLLRLQGRLGLVYGAIDMRRTSGGEYLFLEVNPAGQWLFVEQRTGLPIGRAVAEHLARLDARPPEGHASP